MGDCFPHVVRKNSDPTEAPPKSGIHWVNETTKQWFFSVGNDSVDDWVADTTSTDSQKLVTTFISNGDISAMKPVRAIDLSNVIIANDNTYLESRVIGITTHAALDGEPIKVQLFGKLDDASFNFPLNEPLFVNEFGNITDIFSLDDFHSKIGYSLGNGSIFVQPAEPIELT